MNGMLIRDPDTMERFAGEIMDYSEAMKKVCNDLKASLSQAAPMMKDEVSKRALQKIEALADDLISGLPEAEEAAEKLSAAAKPLREYLASSI
jgi:hypothetical protein